MGSSFSQLSGEDYITDGELRQYAERLEKRAGLVYNKE